MTDDQTAQVLRVAARIERERLAGRGARPDSRAKLSDALDRIRASLDDYVKRGQTPDWPHIDAILRSVGR